MQNTAHISNKPPVFDLEMQANFDDDAAAGTVACAILESAVSGAARVLSIAVAALQLAHRQDGLQTTAEKMAVATTAVNAFDLLFNVSSLQCTACAASSQNLMAVALLEAFKLAAAGTGATSSALVLADPSNPVSDAHTALAKANLALIGAGLIAGVLKYCIGCRR